jgi:hypothetical protein
MPWSAGSHAGTFNDYNMISLGIGILQNSIVEIQVIKGNVENALGHFDLHFSEQYLTFCQSRCHFLRHSNSNPQVAQIFGANPFLV